MSVTDQFAAFHKLHYKDGVAIDEIAKRYFVDSPTISRILKLASLAKPIFQVLKEDEISLDMAKAYAGCGDQDRQLSVFEEWGVSASAYSVRKALRENTYLGDSAKVAFIGLEKFFEEGGVVEEDLFDECTVLTNGDLVDRLFDLAITKHVDALR